MHNIRSAEAFDLACKTLNFVQSSCLFDKMWDNAYRFGPLDISQSIFGSPWDLVALPCSRGTYTIGYTKFFIISQFLDISDLQMSMDTYCFNINKSLMPVAWKDFEMQQQYFDKKIFLFNYLFVKTVSMMRAFILTVDLLLRSSAYF